MKPTTTPAPRKASLTRRLTYTVAALAMAGAGLLTGVGTAQAQESTINGWNTYSDPFRCTVGNDEPTFFCLYYNSGANGAVWKSHYHQGNVWGETFSSDRYGSNGAGQRVWHNAASVENDSWCSLAVYSSSVNYGDVNWVPAGRGGNLTTALKNKEEFLRLGC